MTAWDWQWQMAWDPWEETQRPDWRVRAWRMQQDRARRTKEFEERRRRVALQESAALRRLREERLKRTPAQVTQSNQRAAAPTGTDLPPPVGPIGGRPGETYYDIGGWYDSRFKKDYGTQGFDADALDLGRVYRETEAGLISVDGRARATTTDGLQKAVTSRGEVFWYDPTHFRSSDGRTLRLAGAGSGSRGPSLDLHQVSTRNVVGTNEDGGRILGPVGGPAPLPTTVYAWSPGKGLYAKDVDTAVWENGGTVQSLIEQWETEQSKGATGGTQ